MLFNLLCHFAAGADAVVELAVQTFNFAVKAEAELLQNHVCVGIATRMLATLHHLVEDFINIGEVEVAAHAEALVAEVVAADERMHEVQSGTSGGAIAQVTHVDFAGVGDVHLCKFRIAQLLGSIFLKLVVGGGEDFADCIAALGTFAEEEFGTRVRLHLQCCKSGTFLTTVVLLLHQQIELVKTVHPGSVLFLIVLQWLEQTNQRNATFVFDGFHKYN